MGYIANLAGLNVLEINEIYLEDGEVDLNLIATKRKGIDQIQFCDNVFPLNIPSQFQKISRKL